MNINLYSTNKDVLDNLKNKLETYIREKKDSLFSKQTKPAFCNIKIKTYCNSSEWQELKKNARNSELYVELGEDNGFDIRESKSLILDFPENIIRNKINDYKLGKNRQNQGFLLSSRDLGPHIFSPPCEIFDFFSESLELEANKLDLAFIIHARSANYNKHLREFLQNEVKKYDRLFFIDASNDEDELIDLDIIEEAKYSLVELFTDLSLKQKIDISRGFHKCRREIFHMPLRDCDYYLLNLKPYLLDNLWQEINSQFTSAERKIVYFNLPLELAKENKELIKNARHLLLIPNSNRKARVNFYNKVDEILEFLEPGCCVEELNLDDSISI